jgi:hypothetical protein
LCILIKYPWGEEHHEERDIDLGKFIEDLQTVPESTEERLDVSNVNDHQEVDQVQADYLKY